MIIYATLGCLTKVPALFLPHDRHTAAVRADGCFKNSGEFSFSFTIFGLAVQEETFGLLQCNIGTLDGPDEEMVAGLDQTGAISLCSCTDCDERNDLFIGHGLGSRERTSQL